MSPIDLTAALGGVAGVIVVVGTIGDVGATLIVVGRGPGRWWRASRWISSGAWRAIRRFGQWRGRAASHRIRRSLTPSTPAQEVARATAAAERHASSRWFGLSAAFFPVVLAYWLVALLAGYGAAYVAYQHFWGGFKDAGVSPGTLFFQSGSTLLTLGIAPQEPVVAPLRALALIEAASGLLTYAMVISFLPTFWSSYSRREGQVAILQARKSKVPRLRPADILDDYVSDSGEISWAALDSFFASWESWVADVIGSHVSFPFLIYLRSHREDQAWLNALRTVAEAAAILDVSVPVDKQLSPRAHLLVLRTSRAYLGMMDVLHLKLGQHDPSFEEAFEHGHAVLSRNEAPGAVIPKEDALQAYEGLAGDMEKQHRCLRDYLAMLQDYRSDS